jgi:hypothetical protein
VSHFFFQLSKFQLLHCHRAFAGGLGKGLAGKSATERATQVACGGFWAFFDMPDKLT